MSNELYVFSLAVHFHDGTTMIVMVRFLSAEQQRPQYHPSSHPCK